MSAEEQILKAKTSLSSALERENTQVNASSIRQLHIWKLMPVSIDVFGYFGFLGQDQGDRRIIKGMASTQ